MLENNPETRTKANTDTSTILAAPNPPALISSKGVKADNLGAVTQSGRDISPTNLPTDSSQVATVSTFCVESSTSSQHSNSSPSSEPPAKVNEVTVMDKFSQLHVSHTDTSLDVIKVKTNDESCDEDGSDYNRLIDSSTPEGEDVSSKKPYFESQTNVTVDGKANYSDQAPSQEAQAQPTTTQATITPTMDPSSSQSSACVPISSVPAFPLFPVSRGFRLTLEKTLIAYEQALELLKNCKDS